MTSQPTEPEVILKVENLKMYFPIRRGVFQRHVGDVRAVDDISFDVYRGETLGLVGESGCGKTTTGRTIIRLYDATDGKVTFTLRDKDPDTGEITFKEVDMASVRGNALRQMRRRIQMVFQDPYASLNPRMSVKRIVSEPLDVFGIGTKAEREERVKELLHLVGLNPMMMTRYPHEFSGGQRQRIGLARSLALNPELIVCDEPISALDVSIQAQVVNLLEELQEKLGLTYIFIAHDLSVVRHISDRVAVMYLGKSWNWPTATPFTKTRTILIPRRCSQQSRCRTLRWRRAAIVFCYKVISPARLTRRRVVTSTPVAQWHRIFALKPNRNLLRSALDTSVPAIW